MALGKPKEIPIPLVPGLHYGIQTLKTGMKQSKVNYKCKKPNSGKRSSKQMKKIKTNKNIKRSKTCWRLINVMLFQRRCIWVAGYHLGCVADLIYPQLVINVAKQCRYPCSGQKTNSMHQRLCVSNFFLTPLANNNGFFNKPVMARINFYRLSSQK